MSITTTLRIGARTDVGQIRDHNEDNFVVCKDVKKKIWNDIRPDNFQLGELGSLLMVADGMGGAEAGEEASRIAIETVQTEFSKLESIPKSDNAIYTFLKKTIVNAHQAIVDEAVRNPNWYGMGTTAILAWVIDNRAYLCWSGDSRCYKYNDNGLQLLMDEHSYVWQTFVKKGKMTPEEARNHPESNLITQNLGDARNTPKPDVKKIIFKKGDRILLCSDGLNGMISDDEIESIIARGADLPTTCKELVEAANNAGGDDNITLVLMDVDDLVGVPAGVKDEDVSNGTSNTFGKSMASKAMLITSLVLAGIVAAVFFSMNGDDASHNHKPPTENKTSVPASKDDAGQNTVVSTADNKGKETKAENTREQSPDTEITDAVKSNLAKKNKASAQVIKTIKRLIDKIQEFKNMAKSGDYVYNNEASLKSFELKTNNLNTQYLEWKNSQSKELNIISKLSNEVLKLESEFNKSTFLSIVKSNKEDTVTSPSGNNRPSDVGAGSSDNSTIDMADLVSAQKAKNKPVGKKEQAELKKAFKNLLDENFLFGKDPHYASIRDAEIADLVSTSDRTANTEQIIENCEKKLKEISNFLKSNILLTDKNTLKDLANPGQITSVKYKTLLQEVETYKKSLKNYKALTKEIKLK